MVQMRGKYFDSVVVRANSEGRCSEVTLTCDEFLPYRSGTVGIVRTG